MREPTSTKAPAVAAAEAPRDHESESPDCRAPSRYAAKRFATLQAAAALTGATLYRLEDGRYLLARWGLSRELDTIEDVAAFLRSMGIAA
jgi:hypothetical protein